MSPLHVSPSRHALSAYFYRCLAASFAEEPARATWIEGYTLPALPSIPDYSGQDWQDAPTPEKALREALGIPANRPLEISEIETLQGDSDYLRVWFNDGALSFCAWVYWNGEAFKALRFAGLDNESARFLEACGGLDIKPAIMNDSPRWISVT